MTYQQLPVQGPFEGFVDNPPSPHNPPNSFDEIENFLCWKGRLRTRPKLIAFGNVPDDEATVRAAQTFRDVQGNLHSLVLTTQNGYMITSGPVFNKLTYPVGITSLAGTALPYGIVYSQGKVFFSNGSNTILYSDGETSLKKANAIGSARFMTVNAAHLIVAYVNEPEPGVAGSIEYPYRVRWSKSGDSLDWTAFTAGFSDLLDVADVITGLATLGRNTVVFRMNGITLMGPSGIGAVPFTIETMTSALQGIGNYYPYSLATFDKYSMFVGVNDIYLMDSGLNLQAVGGKAKKRIFKDLHNAAGNQVTGAIITQFNNGQDFLSYWLTIPGVNVSWVYSQDDNSWQRFTSQAGYLSFLGALAVS